MTKAGKMRVLVLTDDRGNVESVVIPNPKAVAELGFQMVSDRVIHKLDVDPGRISREALLGTNGAAARTKAHDALRAMIGGTRARPAPSRGIRRRGRKRARR